MDFPANNQICNKLKIIDIGTVKSYKVQENTNFYQIKVNLFVDFTNINYVYIIENSDKEERKIIEKNL